MMLDDFDSENFFEFLLVKSEQDRAEVVSKIAHDFGMVLHSCHRAVTLGASSIPHE